MFTLVDTTFPNLAQHRALPGGRGRMSIKDHRHGVVAFDCDHPDCITAVRRCVKASQLRRLRGESAYLDATPVRNHIATLRGLNWTSRSIAGEGGVNINVIRHIDTGAQRWVTPAVARRILSIDPDSIPTKTDKKGSQPFVSRVGTIRRLQALMVLGYSHRDLAAHGIPSRNLINQQGQWVLRSTHDKVAAAYRKLSRSPGPTPRSSHEAAKLGYHGPTAWDDIDRDPAPNLEPEVLEAPAIDEVVVLRVLAGDKVPATLAERREITRRWLDAGRSQRQLGELTGWKVERYLPQTPAAAASTPAAAGPDHEEGAA